MPAAMQFLIIYVVVYFFLFCDVYEVKVNMKVGLSRGSVTRSFG